MRACESRNDEPVVPMYIHEIRYVPVISYALLVASPLVAQSLLTPKTSPRDLLRSLQPDSEYLAKFNLQDGDFVHCVIAPEGSIPSSATPLISSTSEEDVDDVDLENPRGFDTLLATGMSRSEITAIRAYFNSDVDAYARTAETVAGESEGDRIYRMEREWMDRQGAGSEVSYFTLKPRPRYSLTRRFAPSSE